MIVLTGIGYGFCYTAAIVKVGFNFSKLRPLASGITVSGAGLGMFAGPPLVQLLIDHYGLSGTFLLLAGISSHYCVFGSLMRPISFRNKRDKSAVARTPEARYSKIVTCPSKYLRSFKSYFQIFNNNGFILYLLSTLCWNVAESSCFAHLPAYCIQKGSSKQQAAFLVSIMGVANLSTRILTGFAANDERIGKLTLLSGQMSLAGVSTVLFPLFVTSYGGQVTYSALLGLYSCGANTLMSPLAVQLVGLADLATAFGIVSLLAGIGYLAGPAIAGTIVDRGATYRESFLFAGSMYLMSGMTALLIPLVHTNKMQDQSAFLQDRSCSIEVLNETTPCVEDSGTGLKQIEDIDLSDLSDPEVQRH